MTKQEAEAFIQQLKNGKRFATRFQEEEWGLVFEGNGRFRKWSERYPDRTEETLTEPQLLDLLTRYYDYQTMIAKLK